MTKVHVDAEFVRKFKDFERAAQARVHEALRQGMPPGEPPMLDLNPRPTPSPKTARQVKILRSADGGLFVVVPDQFGNMRRLLDGTTGEPCDFTRDFGDPRDWRVDLSKEVERVTITAARVCVKMLAERAQS